MGMDFRTYFLAEPTIRFCEDNLAGFIAQPANSYSSLLISLVGILVLIRKRSPLSEWLGWSAIIVGVTSFVYHASFTFGGQLLDLGSMFLLASFLLVAALRRHRLSRPQIGTILVVGTLVPLIVTAIFRTVGGFNVGIPLFALLLLMSIYYEFKTARAERRPLRLYGWAFVVFIGGWIIWWLDFSQVWCQPASFHFLNGHAIWHLANAVAIALLDVYYGESVKK